MDADCGRVRVAKLPGFAAGRDVHPLRAESPRVWLAGSTSLSEGECVAVKDWVIGFADYPSKPEQVSPITQRDADGAGATEIAIVCEFVKASSRFVVMARVSNAKAKPDDELRLFWRAMQAVAVVGGAPMRRLAEGEHFGQSPQCKGRLPQVKQRGLRHERQVDRLLREGLLKNLAGLDLRVTWFPAVAPQPAEAVERRSATA